MGASRIQKVLNDHGGDPDHRQVFMTDPPVVATYRIRHRDPRPRAETHARLLADQPFEGITVRTGVPADVVTPYEKLFYNFSDTVACTDWIAARCFRPRFFTELRDDADVIMGWFGYCFGPEGLDDVIDSLHGGSPGRVPAEGSRADTPEADLIRSLIAADAPQWPRLGAKGARSGLSNGADRSRACQSIGGTRLRSDGRQLPDR